MHNPHTHLLILVFKHVMPFKLPGSIYFSLGGEKKQQEILEINVAIFSLSGKNGSIDEAACFP